MSKSGRVVLWIVVGVIFVLAIVLLVMAATRRFSSSASVASPKVPGSPSQTAVPYSPTPGVSYTPPIPPMPVMTYGVEITIVNISGVPLKNYKLKELALNLSYETSGSLASATPGPQPTSTPYPVKGSSVANKDNVTTDSAGKVYIDSYVPRSTGGASIYYTISALSDVTAGFVGTGQGTLSSTKTDIKTTIMMKPGQKVGTAPVNNYPVQVVVVDSKGYPKSLPSNLDGKVYIGTNTPPASAPQTPTATFRINSGSRFWIGNFRGLQIGRMNVGIYLPVNYPCQFATPTPQFEGKIPNLLGIFGALSNKTILRSDKTADIMPIVWRLVCP